MSGKENPEYKGLDLALFQTMEAEQPLHPQNPDASYLAPMRIKDWQKTARIIQGARGRRLVYTLSRAPRQLSTVR